MSNASSDPAGGPTTPKPASKRRRLPAIILTCGLILSALILLIGVVVSMKHPQCPDNYTQQQVNQTGCTVGADIGSGLAVYASFGVAMATLAVAGIVSFTNRRHVDAGADSSEGVAPTSTEKVGAVETAKVNFPHPAVAGGLVIAVFLISQVIGSFIVGLLAHLTGGTKDPDHITLFGSPILLQFAFILLAEGCVLASLAWYLRRRNVGWRQLGMTKFKWSDAGWAIVAFVVYIAAYVIMLQIVQALVPGFNAEQKQETGFEGASGIVPLTLVFLALVVLAPFTEETLLRGFFFGSLRMRYKFLLSALVTSAVFAALHLGGGVSGEGLLWVAAVDTFVLSMVLCYLREKTGRLWASMLLHATKNCIAFVALFILTH